MLIKVVLLYTLFGLLVISSLKKYHELNVKWTVFQEVLIKVN
jgi:hypothetical protein